MVLSVDFAVDALYPYRTVFRAACGTGHRAGGPTKCWAAHKADI